MPTNLLDRLLDAILSIRGLYPSKKTGIPRPAPLPEEHLRVLLVVVLILAERGYADDEALLSDYHFIRTSEILAHLSPRRITKSAPKPDAALRSLDWLTEQRHIEQAPAPKGAHLIRVAVDPESGQPPRFPGAHKLITAAIALKKAPPALLAILAHYAYAVSAEGIGPTHSPEEVEGLTGLHMRTVRAWMERLEKTGLGRSFGVKHWSYEGGRDAQFFLNLQEPDEREVSPEELNVTLDSEFAAVVAEAAAEVKARAEEKLVEVPPALIEPRMDSGDYVRGALDAAVAEMVPADLQPKRPLCLADTQTVVLDPKGAECYRGESFDGAYAYLQEEQGLSEANWYRAGWRVVNAWQVAA